MCGLLPYHHADRNEWLGRAIILVLLSQHDVFNEQSENAQRNHSFNENGSNNIKKRVLVKKI